MRHDFDNWPEARRSVFADGLIGKLRKAWEQGIADLIQPVMSRFNSQIKGSSLHKLAILNEDDVISVRAARARLSEDLHASPETINPSETTHAELLEELKMLEAWLKDVKERQKTARGTFRLLFPVVRSNRPGWLIEGGQPLNRPLVR